jgi:hypothetical protein
MATQRSREIRLVRRPTGRPVLDDFALVEGDVPALGEGEVLVRNDVMSVDPYMRGRMNDVKSYVPPFVLNEAMTGGAVGTVVESRDPRIAQGAVVSHMLGFRDYAVARGAEVEVVDTSVAPASAYLGILGVTGLTAWVGLFEIGALKEGETVFISGAAGAVGSVAGQLAKLRGAHAIGSAGTAAKVSYLVDTLHFDAAFDYHGDVREALRAAAPGGIELYFDNVGGEQLEAAIGALKPFGRIAACGMISQYNEQSPGPRNMPLVVGKRLRMQGFIVFDHMRSRKAFLEEVLSPYAAGTLVYPETFVDGLERAPEALLSLFDSGDSHIGKLLVRLSAE